MIRNLAALAADFARHNSGILRARAEYAETRDPTTPCSKCGDLRPVGGRCVPCDTARSRAWRERRAK